MKRVAKFAGVLIKKADKILLVQETHREAKGLWSFPLGHIEDYESPKDTALREAEEETGYKIEIRDNFEEMILNNKDFKSTSDFDDAEIHLTVFTGTITNIDAPATGELAHGWFIIEEIKNLPLRGEWIIDVLERYF